MPSLSTSTPAQCPWDKALCFEHRVLPPQGTAEFLKTVGFILKLV